MNWRRLAISIFIFLFATRSGAQSDTARTDVVTHVLRLRDGTTLVGKLLFRDSVSVRFETNGGILTIPASNVSELKLVKAADLHEDGYWFPDPNRTRLFFAPTGRMLDAGEGYYSNTYLFLQNFVGGINDRVTFGGGFSIFPSDDFVSNNVYYLTPKVGVYSTPGTNAAVGALVGYVPSGSGHSFGILYGVSTFGGPDGSVTGGLGYGYVDAKFAHNPALMVGGERRVSRRVAFVTENYMLPTSGSAQFVGSVGLRFMGESLSTDLAIWNTPDTGIFPGIPYVAFAFK